MMPRCLLTTVDENYSLERNSCRYGRDVEIMCSFLLFSRISLVVFPTVVDGKLHCACEGASARWNH